MKKVKANKQNYFKISVRSLDLLKSQQNHHNDKHNIYFVNFGSLN